MTDFDKTVVVIGGATIDICGFAKSDLIEQTSNPGKINVTAGGVGRNIAENLARLGVRTKLITAFGQDDFGKQARGECERAGIDVEHVKLLDGYATSMYVALHDNRGQMALAISHMAAVEAMDAAFIERCAPAIENAAVVVLDTNLRPETIDYILTHFKSKDFFIDPVSVRKAERIKPHLSHCYAIKPNKLEAEVLSGMKICAANDLKKIAEYFLHLGIRKVFLSLGAEGIFYHDENASGYLPAQETTISNDTGAGDAFTAGLVYSHLNGYKIQESSKFAMAAACLTLSCAQTVNPNISLELIKKRMQEVSE